MTSVSSHQLNLQNLQKQQKYGRYWVKQYLKLRNKFLAYRLVFKYLRDNDHEDFKKLIRMSVDQFNLLHDLVQRKLENSSNRELISTELRLASLVM